MFSSTVDGGRIGHDDDDDDAACATDTIITVGSGGGSGGYVTKGVFPPSTPVSFFLCVCYGNGVCFRLHRKPYNIIYSMEKTTEEKEEETVDAADAREGKKSAAATVFRQPKSCVYSKYIMMTGTGSERVCASENKRVRVW